MNADNKQPVMKVACPVPLCYDSTNLYMTLKQFEIAHVLDLPEDIQRESKVMPIPLNTFKFNAQTKQNEAHISVDSNNERNE